jgi:hypothetical protein
MMLLVMKFSRLACASYRSKQSPKWLEVSEERIPQRLYRLLKKIGSVSTGEDGM